LLLDEAAGRCTGAVTFEFDSFDVTLGFVGESVTVKDVLGSDDEETAAMSVFLKHAVSFEDDPSIGDGLTQMQRSPARFEITSSGEVQPLDLGGS
jgi:hypothetical protein